MTNHAEIIEARGGIRPVARQLGHRNHTTVQGWKERNRITPEWFEKVLCLPVVKQCQ